MDEQALSRRQASDAVTTLGWRYVLGVLRTVVHVRSLQDGLTAAAAAVTAAGAEADRHVRVDLRPDLVSITVASFASDSITSLDTALAARISAALAASDAATVADVAIDCHRSVQLLEIAIDALDIASIRPFWSAILGYGDVPGRHGPTEPLIDPVGQGPAVWFQQMDAPRPQRNRIHLDISVPHDEAPLRIRAALDCGGTLVGDAEAPAFWVLADAEGNEACITTWQGRDP